MLRRFTFCQKISLRKKPQSGRRYCRTNILTKDLHPNNKNVTPNQWEKKSENPVEKWAKSSGNSENIFKSQ